MDLDFLTELLEQPQENELSSKSSYINTQQGPLRWYDKEMRCANRGCSSPTFLKLEGIPRCSMHALTQMNEMLCHSALTS